MKKINAHEHMVRNNQIQYSEATPSTKMTRAYCVQLHALLRQHVSKASSCLLLTVLISVWTTLSVADEETAQDVQKIDQGYPPVWERNSNEPVLYFQGDDRELYLKNGLPDVALGLPYKEHGRWILGTFFAGKKFELSSYDKDNSTITLKSGKKVVISWSPPDGYLTTDAHVKSFLLNGKLVKSARAYRLVDGSVITKDSMVRDEDGNFLDRDEGSIYGAFTCDYIAGISRIASDGHIIWSKNYVVLADPKDIKNSWEDCPHKLGQRLMLGAPGVMYSFPDGTLGIALPGKLLRVSVETGLPEKYSSDIRIVDSELVDEFRRVIYKKLRTNPDPNIEPERTFHTLMHDFFFPDTN